MTLIELMVTVAILGLVSAIAGNAALEQRTDGLAVLQAQRAEELLEYQATCVAAGRAPDPQTLGRLTQGLPGAKVALEPAGAATRITVSWAAPRRPARSRQLLVFAKGAK